MSNIKFMIFLILSAFIVGISFNVNAQVILLDEKFDNVTPPAFPVGWSVDVPVIGGFWTWNTTAGPYNPATPGSPSAPNVASFQSYNLTAGSTARLITPAINLTSVSSAALGFKWRYSTQYPSSVDKMYIDASTDGGLTWVQVAGPYNRPSSTGSTYWSDISADIGSYVGYPSVKFAFRGVSAYGNWIHIDNVLITGTSTLANDLGITAISSPESAISHTPQTITGSIHNFGTAGQTTYNVHVKIWKTIGGSPGMPEFERTQSGSPLTSGSTISFSFADQWTPAEFVNYTVKLYTEFAGDQNPLNDTLIKSVTVNVQTDLQVTNIIYPPITGLYLGTLGYSVRATIKNNGSAAVSDYSVVGLIGPTQGFPGSATYSGSVIYKPVIAPGASVNVDLLPSAWIPYITGSHTVRIKVTTPGDENRMNDSLDEFRTVNSYNFGGGGSGTGGYYFANTTPEAAQAPSQPTYSWIDPIAEGHNELQSWNSGNGDDGFAGPITLPFPFLFFGNSYINFFIGSNGIITFGEGSSSKNFTSIPGTSIPNNFIAAAWTDLDTRSTQYSDAHIYYGGDSDKFVITFWHVHKNASSEYITFQVILTHLGNIKIQYNDVETTNPPPSSIVNNSTVGIENSDGTLGIQYRYYSTGGSMFGSPLAVEFGTNKYSLPVELTSFNAAALGKSIIVKWTTATEVSNYGFEIEKSVNHTSFTRIGFVKGEGNSTTYRDYYFTDDDITVNGIYNYRLKQIDLEGSYKYSSTIQLLVGLPKEYTLEQNYPNPFNPATTIRYSIPKDEYVILKVFDLLGKEVQTLINEKCIAGNYAVNFNGADYANGVYIYKIIAGDFISIKKMVLLK